MTLRLNDESDHRASLIIQDALLDHMSVDRRVKPSVIHHIVDMAIHIIVCPACGDRHK